MRNGLHWSGEREGIARIKGWCAKGSVAAVGGAAPRKWAVAIAAAVGLSLALVSPAGAAPSFSPKNYPLPEGTWTGGGGTAPRSDVLGPPALADLNGDGRLDIVIANGYTGKVVVLLNHGSGTFAPAPGSPFAACTPNYQMTSIAAGQLNPKSDHHVDVAVACDQQGIYRLLGDGAGRLGSSQLISPTNAIGPVLFGHLSTDTYGDLTYAIVASPYELPCLAPLNGSGGVETPVCASDNTATPALTLVHFYGNACSGGDETLGFVYYSGDTDWSLNGMGYNPSAKGGPCSEPFQTSGDAHPSGIAFSYNPADPRPSGIAVGDLNGDGTPDVAMADSGGTVHTLGWNPKTGLPNTVPSKFASAGPISSIGVADFNGDGHRDIVAAEYDPSGAHSNWVAIHLGHGNVTTFAPAQKVGVAGVQTNIDELPLIALGDLNGDGKPDIVSGAGHAGVVTVLLNTTSWPPTAAQMRALLLSELAPTGSGAKIGALLSNGGYSFSARALTAGHLVISWYHASGASKAVLVASGAADYSKAATRQFTITLTSKGKQLLKGSNKLALTGKGSFTPSGKPAVLASKDFTVTR